MAEEITTETTTTETETPTNEATTAHNNTETVDGQTNESTLLGGDDKAEAPEKVIPDVYEAFTMPEGSELDENILGEFSTLAKELGLSQDEAQRVIDVGNKSTEAMVNAQQDELIKTRTEWVDSLKKDEEFGGAKFKETVTRAKRTLTKFGDEKLTSLLEKTGYGDNPEIIKLFARIDKAIGEDTVERGTPVNKTNRSAAQTIYG